MPVARAAAEDGREVDGAALSAGHFSPSTGHKLATAGGINRSRGRAPPVDLVYMLACINHGSNSQFEMYSNFEFETRFIFIRIPICYASPRCPPRHNRQLLLKHNSAHLLVGQLVGVVEQRARVLRAAHSRHSTMRVDLSGPDSFELSEIFSQNICSGAR